MHPDDFDALIDSVREMQAVARGEQPPSRAFRWSADGLCVAQEEAGGVVWTLEEALAALQARTASGETLSVAQVRRLLRQPQSAFARLLGVSVGTLRGWEQGRRLPTGPARALLEVLAREPQAVLRAFRHRTTAAGDGAPHIPFLAKK